jgi:glucose/arabinose dehydrogenase
MRWFMAFLAIGLSSFFGGLAGAQVRVGTEPVVAGLHHPWGIDFLSADEALVTERRGQLFQVSLRDGSKRRVGSVPEVYHRGQGGLLDVLVDPNFAQNQRIFLSYAAPIGWRSGTTTVLSARLEQTELVDRRVIFQAKPAYAGGHHFGSRLRLDAEGSLFITSGERGRAEESQNVQSHLGAVLRVHPDGQIPTDNPFVGSSAGLPEIFSYGHRNPQGMAIHPQTGAVWIHEHGPQGGDEINILLAGKNYGWPETTYGEQYGGGAIGVGPTAPGITPPVLHWTPSIAPSGMAFYQGEVFPEWQGDLLVGSLKFQMLVRVDLAGSEVVGRETLLRNQMGRIRDVKVSPDGEVYVLNDQPSGGVFRLVRR